MLLLHQLVQQNIGSRSCSSNGRSVFQAEPNMGGSSMLHVMPTVCQELAGTHLITWISLKVR
jgi:hypothetical protein